MNIQYLKYALVVAKTGSINKAAEKLCLAQPNLSRAIKELETSLGISIFERTSKGMIPTSEGEQLLSYSRSLLSQIEDIENFFTNKKKKKQTMSISVPRGSYFSSAFSNFSKRLDKAHPSEIIYRETNASRAISNIIDSDYKLGIIRYAEKYEKYFNEMLIEKGLEGDVINEFSYVLIMSKESPLARIKDIKFKDLTDYIEIAHADPYVPSLPLSTVKKEELPDNVDKRIFVFERASQFDLLSSNTDTFMWVSPTPKYLLDKYGLIEKKCNENTKVYKELLIYKKDYKLTKLDKMFIEELENVRKSLK